MKGTIRNMTALPRPITARRIAAQEGQQQAANYGKGELVEIVALGDVEGYSPSCWFINQTGEIGLESVGHFQVLDPAFLPNKTFVELTQQGQ